jgi:hypothetical protein
VPACSDKANPHAGLTLMTLGDRRAICAPGVSRSVLLPNVHYRYALLMFVCACIYGGYRHTPAHICYMTHS